MPLHLCSTSTSVLVSLAVLMNGDWDVWQQVSEGYSSGQADGYSRVSYRPMVPRASIGEIHRWDQYRDNHLQYAQQQRHQHHQQQQHLQRQRQWTYDSSARSDWSDLDRNTPESPVQGYAGGSNAPHHYNHHHHSQGRPRRVNAIRSSRLKLGDGLLLQAIFSA